MEGLSFDCRGLILHCLLLQVEAFWAFQMLMDQTEANFHKDQLGMHLQLEGLYEMCKLCEPELHSYLVAHDCGNFFFCFR